MLKQLRSISWYEPCLTNRRSLKTLSQRRVIHLLKARKGYKEILECSRVYQSPFSIVTTLPRSVYPTKMTPKEQRRVFSEVKKNPQVSVTYLKTTLELGRSPTMHQSLNRRGVRGRTPQRKLPLYKNIFACLKFAKLHLGNPQWNWKNTLWTDEMKAVKEAQCTVQKGPSLTTSKYYLKKEAWWRKH